MVLNKAKKLFSETVTPALNNLPAFSRVTLEYVLYTRTRRVLDISNVCSVVDKFFCDALVRSGHLEDDNFKFIDRVVYSFGGMDSDNPRVDVHITGEIKDADYSEPE